MVDAFEGEDPDVIVVEGQGLFMHVREKFLSELEDEIRLAKEELAGAGK